MATRATPDRRIENALDAVFSMLGDLPEVAGEWDDLTDGERASWSLEWDHAMGTYLVVLDRHYCSGELTSAQQASYRKLLQELKEALPLIEKLKLYPPPVPLNT